jgi:hypothetical protein
MVYWWLLFTGSLQQTSNSPVRRTRLAQALLPRTAPFWVLTLHVNQHHISITSYYLGQHEMHYHLRVAFDCWKIKLISSSKCSYSFATTSPDYKKKTQKAWKFGTPKTLIRSFTPCSSPQRFNASYWSHQVSAIDQIDYQIATITTL